MKGLGLRLERADRCEPLRNSASHSNMFLSRGNVATAQSDESGTARDESAAHGTKRAFSGTNRRPQQEGSRVPRAGARRQSQPGWRSAVGMRVIRLTLGPRACARLGAAGAPRCIPPRSPERQRRVHGWPPSSRPLFGNPESESSRPEARAEAGATCASQESAEALRPRTHTSRRRRACLRPAAGHGHSRARRRRSQVENLCYSKRSWIGCTASGAFRIPSMARTQASAAGSVVMQGTP